MKGIVVYGSRYGATKETAEEIAKILRTENFDVKVVNAKEEKVKDISEYALVAVGSGIACNKWVNEAEDFLKKFQKELAHKKLVLFVSSVKSIPEKEGKIEEVAKIRKAALDDKVSKYNLNPIKLGFFGGIIDFNRMGFLTRKGMEAVFKLPLQKHGFKENEPGAYDLRDWGEIQKWTKELAKKALE
jgi:menaquinone-dependent protoporphyrinogen IX oxidase